MNTKGWIRKLAVADILHNRLRSIMTVAVVLLITTLASSCVILYLSLLESEDKSIYGDINFSVGFYIFLIIPVFICGFLLIIDCFHLDKENAVRQNGLMSSVGLTSKQNKSLLRWQTFYLSAAGILLSIPLIFMLIYLILPLFIGDIYEGFQITGIKEILIVMGVFGLISMALVNTGLYISFFESDQFSVAERIGYSGRLPYNKRESLKGGRGKKITPSYPKRYLTENKLAGKNYLRNIKNNGHVLASIILSLSTLLTVNIVLAGINPNAFADTYVGKNDFKLYNETFSFDYTEEGSSEELLSGPSGIFKSPAVEVFDNDLIHSVRLNDKIDKLKVIKTLFISYTSDEDIDNQSYEDTFNIIDTKYLLSRFDENSKPDSETIKKFEDGEIALVGDTYDDMDNLQYNISGDVVYENFTGNEGLREDGENRFDMAVYNMPIDYAEGNPHVNTGFYVHENFLENIGIDPIISSVEFCADKQDRDEIQRWIDKKIENNKLIKVESRDRAEALVKAQKKAFFLVGYLLALILIVISFIGFTIVSIVSADTRKKEFFILKCVGMNRSDIKSMLFTEGLIYGIVVLFIMGIIANPFIFLIYNNFKMYYNTYNFPYIMFTISMIVTMAIIIIVPIVVYNRKSMNEQGRSKYV